MKHRAVFIWILVIISTILFLGCSQESLAEKGSKFIGTWQPDGNSIGYLALFKDGTGKLKKSVSNPPIKMKWTLRDDGKINLRPADQSVGKEIAICQIVDKHLILEVGAHKVTFTKIAPDK